jgi:transposase
MKITTIGIDLAKNVLQLHGVDERGKVVLRKSLKRAQVLSFFANLPACRIGLEACGSAHHWARQLTALGHTVRLMAPQFVKPYVKTNKHDAADAEAICEALQRPNMRFVAIKTVEQQAVLALHRGRQGFVKARTAQGNQIRGLLAEFGVVVAPGRQQLTAQLPAILEDGANGLPGTVRELLQTLQGQLQELDRQVAALEQRIQRWHREQPASRKLAAIPGIGPLTASALVATIGDVRQFQNGRQLAAWLGLVPRQYSTGGKTLLLGISKRGDSYLRTLLIHGARAVVAHRVAKLEPAADWLSRLLARRNQNKNLAAVALANKNARIVWAMLAHDRTFDAHYQPPTAMA